MNDPHILGTERIGKLLVQYSIPAIIGMTITSLYNIIDSIFIGHGDACIGNIGIAGYDGGLLKSIQVAHQLA